VPIVKKTAENVAPKESERQLSKKELKKKELAELEDMLAEFGLNKAESNDDSQGNLLMIATQTFSHPIISKSLDNFI